MTEFTQFLSENMYIVAATLYVLGIFAKSIPKIPDWTIPFALSIIGIAFGILIIGIPQGVLQGILCAGAAVLVNQYIKQAGKAGETANTDESEPNITPEIEPTGETIDISQDNAKESTGYIEMTVQPRAPGHEKNKTDDQ